MADSIYEKRVRDMERLTHTLRRQLTMARHRPHPPRGVRLTETKVMWEPPRETRNVTHFNIYSPTERTLVHRAPLGQTSWGRLADLPGGGGGPGTPPPSAAVSSYNEVTGMESRKIAVKQS